MKMSEIENRLRKHAETTKSVMQAPFDLKEEIKKMEGHVMRKPKSSVRKIVAIAAVLTLCILTVSITPLAGSIKGFFSDIIRYDGAVTGTKYENASNDIKVSAMEITSDNGSDIIPLELTFENSTEAPFLYIQKVAVGNYMILDSKTGEVLKIESYPEYSGKGTVENNKAVVNLSIKDVKLKSGEEYIIVIEKMYGLSKADASTAYNRKMEMRIC